MRLHELVEVSAAVAHARGRLEKAARLSELFKRMPPDEIQIGVAFLSGARLQGRMGLGWSAMSSARDVPAADRPSLELRDVVRAFGEIARVSGAGAIAERSRLLAALFGKSTIVEQAFLCAATSARSRTRP